MSLATPTTRADKPPVGSWRARMLLALVIGLALLWLARSQCRAWAEQVLDSWRSMLALLLVGVILAVPVLRRMATDALSRLRSPSRSLRAWVMVLIAILAATYLAATAVEQGRGFYPKWSDEYMHLIQMRMMAEGRLWLAERPLADFFESYFLFNKGVYASMYFPGASLLYLPAVWLHLPPWALPLAAAGLCVGLTYRVVAELLDGLAGMLSALILVGSSSFRYTSLLVTSHVPLAVLGIALVWAWLRWRERRRPVWAVVAGVLAGWLFITRPLDSLCYLIPVGLAVLLDLRGHLLSPSPRYSGESAGVKGSVATRTPLSPSPRYSGESAGVKGSVATRTPLSPSPRYSGESAGVKGSVATRTPLSPSPRYSGERAGVRGFSVDQRASRRWLTTLACVVLGAAPFALLQATFNYGVCGNIWRTPVDEYSRINAPGYAVGLRAGAAGAPQTTLPQKLALYRQFTLPALNDQRPAHILPNLLTSRLPEMTDWTLPTPLFALLLPVGLFALGRRRWVLGLAPLLFIGVYALWPFWLNQYPAAVAGPTAFLAALGLHTLASGPLARHRAAGALLTILVAGVSIASLPGLTRGHDDTYPTPTMEWNYTQLPHLVKQPAVVLFVFHDCPSVTPAEEPVYNWETARPEEAPIVRAHDLGPERNLEIFRYYAERSPDRLFYRYDRQTQTLTPLGTARSLAARTATSSAP